MRNICLILIAICLICLPSQIVTYVQAEEFGGLDFPDGERSFADSVVSFTPGTYGVSNPSTGPSKSLGAPDYIESDDAIGDTFISIGNGGTLVVKFQDNSLSTSGNNDPDLWIFEIGARVERIYVYISEDGTNWIDLGSVEGATSGIDIDSYIGNGVVVGGRYSYVKLVDDINENEQTHFTAGADIDAIGAISSTEPVEPICDCIDSDNDGVIDIMDICPGTPENSWVNKTGCPASSSESQYADGFDAGKQYCIENPEACDIEIGVDYQDGYDQGHDDGYKEGLANCSNGSCIPATLSPELNMHIPELQYTMPFGSMSFWIDLEFAGESNGDLLWKLSDFGEE